MCFYPLSVSDEPFESAEDDKVKVVIEEAPINTGPRFRISYEAVRTSSWLVGAILIFLFLVHRWFQNPYQISSRDLALLHQLLENYQYQVFFESTAGFIWHFCNRTTFECAWCKPDWIMHDSRCYFMANDTRTWESAEEECKQYEGHLPIVLTVEDQVLLSKMATEIGKENNIGVWIGLRYKTNGGSFSWVTGETLASNNSFWQPEKANNTTTFDVSRGGKECVAIVPSKNDTEEDWYYNWDNVVCDTERHVICENQDFLSRWNTFSKE